MRLNLRTIRIVVFALLTSSGTAVLGQGKTENQLFSIHKEVLSGLRSPATKYHVSLRTDKDVFSNFNFKDPSGIDSNPDRIWKKPAWISFLSDIDTASLSNYSLSTKGKPWFKTRPKNQKSISGIRFAPIIISEDNSKALCILRTFDGDSGGDIVFYLETNNDKWEVKHVQTFAFFEYSLKDK